MSQTITNDVSLTSDVLLSYLPDSSCLHDLHLSNHRNQLVLCTDAGISCILTIHLLTLTADITLAARMRLRDRAVPISLVPY
jgi:hypothetical protein